jgi:hypothetical protein
LCWPQGWLVLLPNVNVPKCSYNVIAIYLEYNYALTLHCVGILKPMFFEYRQFLLSKHEGFYYKESSHPNHKFFVWFFTPKFMSSTSIVITITMNEIECIIPYYVFHLLQVVNSWRLHVSSLKAQKVLNKILKQEQNLFWKYQKGIDVCLNWIWCIICCNLQEFEIQPLYVCWTLNKCIKEHEM